MIIKSTYMGVIVIDDLGQNIQAGNNEVDSEKWKRAISKYNLQTMIDSGRLVEVIEDKNAKVEYEKKARDLEKKEELAKEKEELIKEKIKQMETATSEEKIVIKKDLISEKKELTDIQSESKKLNKEINILSKKNEFVELSNEKKRDIVKNTYNIKSLEEWRGKDSDADIRNRIDDQIKAIKNHEIKSPTEKPGSHI